MLRRKKHMILPNPLEIMVDNSFYLWYVLKCQDVVYKKQIDHYIFDCCFETKSLLFVSTNQLNRSVRTHSRPLQRLRNESGAGEKRKGVRIPLHARYCMRESVPKRRKPPGRKLAIPGKAPGEGRIRARRSDSPDRKPEELSCPGPSDSGRALRVYSSEDESADPFPQGKEVGVFVF